MTLNEAKAPLASLLMALAVIPTCHRCVQASKQVACKQRTHLPAEIYTTYSCKERKSPPESTRNKRLRRIWPAGYVDKVQYCCLWMASYCKQKITNNEGNRQVEQFCATLQHTRSMSMSPVSNLAFNISY
jgi:hypothetical protein